MHNDRMAVYGVAQSTPHWRMSRLDVCDIPFLPPCALDNEVSVWYYFLWLLKPCATDSECESMITFGFLTEALSRIRQAMPVNGIWLEGPARVSLFVYDNDTCVVYPYVMEGVQRTVIRLHVKGATALTAFGEPGGGERRIEPLYTKNGEAVFDLSAMPGRYVLYQAER